jgi:hypothetical protein
MAPYVRTLPSSGPATPNRSGGSMSAQTPAVPAATPNSVGSSFTPIPEQSPQVSDTVPPSPFVVKPKPKPVVDPHDPRTRYQLLTIGRYEGYQKAFIKDLVLEESKLLRVGEKIGDCKLVGIYPAAKTIRMKPSKGAMFNVKRD